MGRRPRPTATAGGGRDLRILADEVDKTILIYDDQLDSRYLDNNKNYGTWLSPTNSDKFHSPQAIPGNAGAFAAFTCEPLMEIAPWLLRRRPKRPAKPRARIAAHRRLRRRGKTPSPCSKPTTARSKGWFEKYERLSTDADKTGAGRQDLPGPEGPHPDRGGAVLSAGPQGDRRYRSARRGAGGARRRQEPDRRDRGDAAPGQPLYDAKVKVLGEQVRHHVEEEETELFPEVRKTDLDLEAHRRQARRPQGRADGLAGARSGRLTDPRSSILSLCSARRPESHSMPKPHPHRSRPRQRAQAADADTTASRRDPGRPPAANCSSRPPAPPSS